MNRPFSVMPFLVALVVAVAAMPTNVYQICAWNVGTLEIEPWRRKASTLFTSVARQVRSVFASLFSPRWALAGGLALALLALHVYAPDSGGHVSFAAVGGFAIIRPKLEAELAEAKKKGEAVMVAADNEKRELTAEERKQVQEHLDEGKRIKARIDQIDGDEEMRKQIAALGGGVERPAFTPGGGGFEKSKGRTIGQHVVASDAYKLAKDSYSKGQFTASLEIAAASLTEDAASGGDLITPEVRPGVLPKLQRRIMVTDLIAPGTTGSNVVEYLEETTFTNAAAPRDEGVGAADSTLVYDRKSTTVRSIDHFLPVTAEMLEDVGQLSSYIDGRLRLGVGLAEEDQLLNGTGVAPALQGIYTHLSLHAAQAKGADSNADAIFKQIMALATDSFVFPDGIVINPANWQTIVLAKDGNGVYYGSGPFGPNQVPVLWGLPAAVTPLITATNALVGAYATCAQRFTRRGVTVTLSNSHSDYFTKRLVAVLAGMREALAIYRPGAFGKVTGLT